MSRDLRLSVILSAVDKLTAPVKRMQQANQGLAGALRANQDQLKGLEKQQSQIRAFQDMTRQAKESRSALQAKREELTQINRRLAESVGPAKRLTQQQQRAQREVDKLTQSYRQQTTRARELAKGLPAKAEGIRNLGHQQAELARQVAEATARIERQQRALKLLGEADVSGKFGNMTQEVGRFGRRAAMLGGAAAGGIFALANSTATLGDETAKTADLMGIGIAELQELRYAAERSGVATDSLDGSMQRFVRRVGRAAQGGGAAAKAYDELGLSAKALGQMTPDQALSVVADRLEEVTNQTDRVAYASALFGNEGEGMLRMLNGGSGALQDLRNQAHATGNVLSEEAARDAEDFKDALLDAQMGLQGMRHTIGAQLMPAVAKMMRNLSGWMAENRDQVERFADAFGTRMTEAVPVLMDIARGGGRVASVLQSTVSTLANLVGGYDRLAAIVAALFAAKAIASVIAFGIALGKAGVALGMFASTLPAVVGGVKALGLAFMATPVGWVVAGIAAIAAGAIYLWKNWETIGPKFSAMWEGIVARAGRAWQEIREAFSGGIQGVSALIINWSPLGLFYKAFAGVMGWFGVELPSSFTEFGGMLMSGLAKGITDRIAAVRDAVTGVGDSVTGWFRDRLGISSPSKVFASHGMDVMRGLSEGLGDGESGPLQKVKQIAKSLTQAGAGLALGGTLAVASAAMPPADPGRTLPDLQGLARYQVELGPLPELPQLQGIAQYALQMPGASMPSMEASDPLPMDTRPPLSAPATGGSTINLGDININIQATPGMNEQSLAQYVAREVERALEQAARQQAARTRSTLHDLD
jgi:hypothetical protein